MSRCPLQQIGAEPPHPNGMCEVEIARDTGMQPSPLARVVSRAHAWGDPIRR
jgi:hypothetical protein